MVTDLLPEVQPEVCEEAGSNPPPPPGYYRTWLYCSHWWGRSHCSATAVIQLNPTEGRGR